MFAREAREWGHLTPGERTGIWASLKISTVRRGMGWEAGELVARNRTARGSLEKVNELLV